MAVLEKHIREMEACRIFSSPLAEGFFPDGDADAADAAPQTPQSCATQAREQRRRIVDDAEAKYQAKHHKSRPPPRLPRTYQAFQNCLSLETIMVRIQPARRPHSTGGSLACPDDVFAS